MPAAQFAPQPEDQPDAQPSEAEAIGPAAGAVLEDYSALPFPVAAERLAERLWAGGVLEAVGEQTIRAGCEGDLRQMVDRAVQRMQQEDRTSPADVALALSSLRSFVAVMQAEAVLLGHPDALGEDTFHGADATLRARALRAPGFSLWPIWPW